MAAAKPLRKAPRDLSVILAQQPGLTLPHFTADDAFTLGTTLRNRIRSLTSNPAVISITLANNDHLLFHSTTGPGTSPDNDIWVARKRNTVKRWGVPSWALNRKFDGDEKVFREKFALGETAREYAIHGGGVPVRVEGVEGVVAVVVVSGLKQEEDHMVVVEGLEEVIEGMKGAVNGVEKAVDGVEEEGNGVKKEGNGVGGSVDVGEKDLAETEEGRVMVDEANADGAVLAS